MKSSLNNILVKALVGKKIVKQEHIYPNYWGATITDVYATLDWHDTECAVYVIRTNIAGNNVFKLDPDYELEVE